MRWRPAPDRRILDNLQGWLHHQLATVSGKSPLAQAIRYALTCLRRLTPDLTYGIPEIDSNNAEHAVPVIAGIPDCKTTRVTDLLPRKSRSLGTTETAAPIDVDWEQREKTAR